MAARNKKSKRAGERLVTEAYLDTRLNETRDGLETYVDTRLHETRKGIKDETAEEMRSQTAKILQAVDGVMTRFDVMEKEEAAHTALHQRLADTLHQHDQRIGK